MREWINMVKIFVVRCDCDEVLQPFNERRQRPQRCGLLRVADLGTLYRLPKAFEVGVVQVAVGLRAFLIP